METEVRVCIFPIEIRAKPRENKLPMLEGTAIPYNSRSQLLYGLFYEQFATGAFSECLRGSPDVPALVDHDSSKVLGRTAAKTLTLSEDDRGIHFELDPANTSYGRDMVELITRGDITGMSFGFRVAKDGDAWGMYDNKELRTVTRADLKEISLVAFPAYKSTEVMKRSLDSVSTAHREMIELSRKQQVETLDLLRRKLQLLS